MLTSRMHHVADIIADLGLVALPIWLLREAKLSWTRRILIQSVFSASICITIITIIHSVILLSETSSGTLFFGHFKVSRHILFLSSPRPQVFDVHSVSCYL